MNATIASQILDDPKISRHEKTPAPEAKQPASLLSSFLLPVVALAVGILPLIYLGFTGLIFWALWEYSVLVNQSFIDLPGYLRISICALPVIPGTYLITALLHPIRSIRKERREAFAVIREDEPSLVSFIHRIADATGAPRPAVIELDCSPGITVEYLRGFLNPELRLVIGMPVIAKLSSQSFGGALARELGPYSHPMISRLREFVLRIGSAFQKMTRWNNPVESRIETISERIRRDGEDAPSFKRWLIVPCLYFVRTLMALVRRLLAVFSAVSKAMSAFVLRHLEYQADAGQIALSGSENFGTTVRHLAGLEAACSIAREKTASLANEDRLSRDYPNLVCHLSDELPPNQAALVRESCSGSSSWLEFRPSIRERIQVAYHRDDAGIFSPEKPASSLIRDPESLGEIVTRHWYRTEWDFDSSQFELVSNEALNRDSSRAVRQTEAAAEFFGGTLDPYRPFFPTRNSIDQFTDLAEMETRDIPKASASLAERNRILLGRFDELVQARLNAVEFHQLALAGYPIEPGKTDQEERDPDALKSVVEFLDRQLLQTSMKLGPFEDQCARLIAAATKNLGTSRKKAAQVDTWFYHLAVIEQIYSVVPELKDLATRLGALVRRQPDSDLSGQCEERFAIHMKVCELLKRVEEYLGSLPYPFDDYGNDPTMWDYLTTDVGTRNEAIAQSSAMANAVIDRIGEFYLRVMGQLAIDLNQEPENDDSTLFDRWAKLASL